MSNGFFNSKVGNFNHGKLLSSSKLTEAILKLLVITNPCKGVDFYLDNQTPYSVFGAEGNSVSIDWKQSSF